MTRTPWSTHVFWKEQEEKNFSALLKQDEKPIVYERSPITGRCFSDAGSALSVARDISTPISSRLQQDPGDANIVGLPRMHNTPRQKLVEVQRLEYESAKQREAACCTDDLASVAAAVALATRQLPTPGMPGHVVPSLVLLKKLRQMAEQENQSDALSEAVLQQSLRSEPSLPAVPEDVAEVANESLSKSSPQGEGVAPATKPAEGPGPPRAAATRRPQSVLTEVLAPGAEPKFVARSASQEPEGPQQRKPLLAPPRAFSCSPRCTASSTISQSQRSRSPLPRNASCRDVLERWGVNVPDDDKAIFPKRRGGGVSSQVSDANFAQELAGVLGQADPSPRPPTGDTLQEALALQHFPPIRAKAAFGRGIAPLLPSVPRFDMRSPQRWRKPSFFGARKPQPGGVPPKGHKAADPFPRLPDKPAPMPAKKPATPAKRAPGRAWPAAYIGGRQIFAK